MSADKKPYHKPHLTVVSTNTRPEGLVIIALSIELQDSIEALRALLALYDRRDDTGWTAAEVERLAEIRAVVINPRHGEWSLSGRENDYCLV